MSVEQWGAMSEDEPGELVDGRLVEEEVADCEHEAIISHLHAVLRGWAVPRGGVVAGSGVKFALGEWLGRKPDLSVFLPGGSVPPQQGLVRVPPDIMVEVLMPTAEDARRDRVDKVRDYAGFNVRGYWIVDPQLRSFEVLEHTGDGHYRLMLAATEGNVMILGCEGLTLDLDALWSEVVRLGHTE